MENRRPGGGRRGAGCLLAALAILTAPAEIPHADAQTSPYASITVDWDANPEPAVTGYFVFVGTRPGVYDERHDVGLQTRFTHFGLIGQEYFFTVAAYSASGMSPLSAEVSAVGAPWFDVTAMPRAAAASCSDCTDRVFRARGLGAVSALTAASDGRLFFIEDRRHIRIAAPTSGAVLPTGLSATAGVEFTGLALAEDFSQSGHVFVAASRRSADGTRELSIVRYREVQNSLGEGAVAVTGLRLWSDRDAPFAVGPLGRIYVAMPLDGRPHGDPHAGYVLWFEADGRVPAAARGGSPILAHGFAAPVALDVDGGVLWLVGADAAWTRSLARLEPELPAGAEWPRVPAGIPATGPPDPSPAAARAFDAPAHGSAKPGIAILVDAAGRLQRLRTLGNSRAERLPAAHPGYPDAAAVAIGPGGDAFIAFPEADGTFAIEQIPGQ